MMSRSLKSKNLPRPSKEKFCKNVTLERVLGFTAVNNCSVAFDSKTSTIFYSAGCVIVAESCESNRQSFIQSPSRKAITCLDISQDGKFIATGEFGHQPMVRIWNRAERCEVGELKSHHLRISCVHFSPSGRHIVSVGSPEDKTICVWDRALLQKIASAKVSAKVNALSFSESGHFFVTVGIRHVRFWYLDTKKRMQTKETQPLQGRNATLGDNLNNTFTDVCCLTPGIADSPTRTKIDSTFPTSGQSETSAGVSLTLVLSQAGQLLQFNETRCVSKWVDLKVEKAYCMALSQHVVAVGCTAGVCLLFEAATLQFLARIPLPHSLGMNNSHFFAPARSLNSNMVDVDIEKNYPDVIAVSLDWPSRVVLCMYADHSIHCWDLSSLTSISRRFSHFYHSRGVCATTVDGLTSSTSTTTGLEGARWITPSGDAPCPLERFVTASDDGTVRIWAFPVNRPILKTANISDSLYEGDKVESVEIIYTEPQLVSLHLNNEKTASSFGSLHNLASIPASPSLNYRSTTSLFEGAPFPGDSGNRGLRALAISPEGHHLAVGNRSGQIKIYDLETFKLLHSIPAHDAEILCLSYFSSKTIPGMTLFCSSSRDRVIHVFEPKRDYSLVQTLADHSGAISTARFVETLEGEECGGVGSRGKIYLISCGADRSLLFRTLSNDPENQTARFVLEHHVADKNAHADAVVVGPSYSSFNSDATTTVAANQRLRHYLVVACQDRWMHVYQVANAKKFRGYRASLSEDGTVLCCAVDPTSTFVANAVSDKRINLFHLFTGEHVTTLFGHSGSVASLIFLPDLRHLVSVSHDSCIFVWRLAPELTHLMLDRQNVCSGVLPAVSSSPHLLISRPDQLSTGDVKETWIGMKSSLDSPTDLTSNFCLNETELPHWARKNCYSESEKKEPESHTPPRRSVKRAVTANARNLLNDDSSRERHTSSPSPVFFPTNKKKGENMGRSHSVRISAKKITTKRIRNQTVQFTPTYIEQKSEFTGYLRRRNSLLSCSSCSSVSCISDREDHDQPEENDEPPKWTTTVNLNLPSNSSSFEPEPVNIKTEESYNLRFNLDGTEMQEADDTRVRHRSSERASWPATSDLLHPPSSGGFILKKEENGESELNITKPLSSLTLLSFRRGRSLPLEDVNIKAIDQATEDLGPPLPSLEPTCNGVNQSSCSEPSSISSDALQVNSVRSGNSESRQFTALTNIREALDLAVSEFDRLNTNNPEHTDPLRVSGQIFFQDELEWRFSRLRALLGLESACVEPPVARTLVADLTERLLPHIRLALCDSFSGERGTDLGRILADVIERQTLESSTVRTNYAQAQ